MEGVELLLFIVTRIGAVAAGYATVMALGHPAERYLRWVKRGRHAS